MNSNMQTPTKARPGSLEVPQKTSPTTPPRARKLKTPGSDAAAVSSPNPASKTPKVRSPKVVVRRSPRSPATETKRSGRVSELETQLAQLQDESKRAKDQLSSSESWKRKAQQEAEEAKTQLAAMSAKLEETQKQLEEISENEEARVQELRKLSQDRDRAWQSELEAVQKQHLMDSAALASAMNEIQRLKIQLDRVCASEAAQARHAESAYAEIQNLREELTETFALVEKLRAQLTESKESEEQALEDVSKLQMQLEVAKTNEETLQAEGREAGEAYKSLVFELEQSKNRVSSLEEIVSKLQAERGNSIKGSEGSSSNVIQENGENEKPDQLKAELSNTKLEVSQLRAALEAAERRYQEEYIQSTLQIRSAYELVEQTKAGSCQREAELEAKFESARAEVERLKEKLLDRETELRNISEEIKGLNQMVEQSQLTAREQLEIELEKSKSVLAELNGSLMEKETELQNISKENELLKSEIKKWEIERKTLNDEALAFADAARAAEGEALMKLANLTEEADKSSKKAAQVTEQLDAAEAANSKMEGELKRLKIQAEQWRKAAEAATAMLTTGSNGNYVERTSSLDSHTLGGKLALPYSSDDMDDDSPKKKNGNMLKKIGVLLKKGQK